MRARCEQHGLALGPSGCLLCRRSAAPQADGALSGAPLAPGAASVVPGSVAPTPAGVDAGEALAAPATVTDAPASRRLNIQISPLALLLPVGALALYLCMSLLGRSPSVSERPVESGLVAAESRAAAPESAQPESELGQNGDAPAEAEPALELPRAELERLREKAQRSAQQAQQLSEARSRVKVNVYYTDRCPHCSEAHGYLVAHGIQAAEHDIDKDARARARHRKLNPKGSLPTIEVDGQVLPGFDPVRLERALDRAGRARIRRGH